MIVIFLTASPSAASKTLSNAQEAIANRRNRQATLLRCPSDFGTGQDWTGVAIRPPLVDLLLNNNIFEELFLIPVMAGLRDGFAQQKCGVVQVYFISTKHGA